MSWICPECGNTNESGSCQCGYAYYKVLGTKPGDSRATVQQTCNYLLKLWKEKASTGDQVTRQRAAARLQKIQAAQDVFKQMAPPKPAGMAGLPQKNVLLIAAAAAIILVIALAVFFMSGKEKPKEQLAPVPAAQPAAGPQPVQPAATAAPQQAQDQQLGAVPPPPPPALDSSVEKNDQWAVDEVKKSHVLEKFMTVDEVAKKWAEKRSTWKALGWQAKKMDSDIYLVSYLMSDGLNMDGMYFDISTSTGVVRHLANYPELQEKYGIRYKK